MPLTPKLWRGRAREGSIREGTFHGGLPYIAVGTGPPVLVLPGLGSEHGNPTGMDRTTQVRSLTSLARRFTVYAVNRKPGLPRGSTISDLADQHAEAIAHAFREPVVVQGISTGGTIAQQLAIAHPQLVRRLVLVASACRLSEHGRAVQRELERQVLAGRPRRGYATYGRALAATATGGHVMAALMWLVGDVMCPQDPSGMIATIEAEDRFDASRQLHRITAPTLLIAGGRDRFYSPELFRETAARIPNARLRLYPRTGHGGTLMHPSAMREIVRFLTAGAPPAIVERTTAARRGNVAGGSGDGHRADQMHRTTSEAHS